jgi:hypothetical protein
MFFGPSPAEAFARMVRTAGIAAVRDDLRGNRRPGRLAMGVAGWFTDKPDQRLGTMYMRGNSLVRDIPDPNCF